MSIKYIYTTDRADDLVLTFETPQEWPDHVQEAILEHLAQAYYIADEELLTGRKLHHEGIDVRHFHNSIIPPEK